MATKNKESPRKVSIQNRRARYDYFIEEEVEAGLVLVGTEVKSLRAGRANINDAYAGGKDGELWLFNADIAVYEGGNRMNHEPRRARKLLMHKHQMNKLLGRVRAKGATLIPLSLYFNKRGFAKILLGLAKGKKEFDKRATTKEREWEREQSSLLKKNKK